MSIAPLYKFSVPSFSVFLFVIFLKKSSDVSPVSFIANEDCVVANSTVVGWSIFNFSISTIADFA
ncbi:hypothetical protein D3C78_1062350 [compost metagenome]